jgi:hypothetical protein
MQYQQIERDTLIKLAHDAMTETSRIDFKREFNPSATADFLQLIKDLVAMANSGGGCLIVGLNDDGTPSNTDLSDLMSLDPAKLTDRVAKYTGVQFGRFEIMSLQRGPNNIGLIIVLGADRPMVFEKPGSYEQPPGTSKTAFAMGTIYFRHGAKSEPATNDDIIATVDAQISRIRESWLGNIRQVVEAPVGHVVHMLPPDVTLRDDPAATAIRITDSEDAPAYRIDSPDKNCPYRQRDVLAAVAARLGPSVRFNQYDIQAISYVHGINASKPDLFYQSRFGPKQYSDRFIEWIVNRATKDPSFLSKIRDQFREALRKAHQ